MKAPRFFVAMQQIAPPKIRLNSTLAPLFPRIFMVFLTDGKGIQEYLFHIGIITGGAKVTYTPKGIYYRKNEVTET